jgi:hypothetical protein
VSTEDDLDQPVVGVSGGVEELNAREFFVDPPPFDSHHTAGHLVRHAAQEG